MKKLKTYYLFAFAILLSMFSYGQQRAVSNIEKNINEQAAGLEQNLNFTLDTLTLRSDKKILRVTFLNHEEKDSEIIDVGSHEIKIPLYHFKKGRYTIAVYTEEKIIALGVKRIDNIPVPKNAIADLEESILRSSLTEKEQLNRNIKPLKKKTRITRDNDTRIASVKPKRTKSKKKDRVIAAKVKKTSNEKVVAAITKKAPKPKKKDRVAAVTKKVSKSKRRVKKRPNANKKSGFALAVEKEAKSAAEKPVVAINRAKDEKAMLAAKKDKPKSQGTLITVTKVTYNLTDKTSESIEKQTRADYRANNLRPNGTSYEN